MDYIKHKGKSIPIRYDHTAIKMIMTKFELANFEDIDDLKIISNIFVQPEILKIGLIRGSKFAGENKDWSDEEVEDILNDVEAIVTKFLSIMQKDFRLLYTVAEDEEVLKKVVEAKKKKE